MNRAKDKKKSFKLSPALSSLSRLVGKAIGDYEMIKDKDRILVAVSGGKDSALLLTMLRHFQQVAPIDFEIRPVFVDIGLPGFPVMALKKYLKSTALKCDIVPAPNLKDKPWSEIKCYSCSKERRNLLFERARLLKFNKIALGHNLDDLAETILLNLFFRAEIGAMCPRQEFFQGRLQIIRPLAYVRAEEIAQLAKQGEIPTWEGDKCPRDEDSQRMQVRRLLKKIEQVNPQVKRNVINALRNIRREYLF